MSVSELVLDPGDKDFIINLPWFLREKMFVLRIGIRNSVCREYQYWVLFEFTGTMVSLVVF